MKRLFALFVVLTLVLGTTAGALAAFEDVEDTDYEDAVTVLNTLEILQGYPDGTFKPDSTITRAEFAAVAIRAMGLDDLAKLQAGPTPFPDVPATHWASGYINLAADQGLINGYPDGTFQPSAQVTYVESLAILARTLGFKDELVKGTWPTNYMIKAFELGLTGDVSFTYNEPATRGNVALFTDNALTAPLLVQTQVGDEEVWIVDDTKSLLTDKLGFTTGTGFVQEVPQMFGDDLEDDEVVVGGSTFAVAEGINLFDWLGKEIKYWLDGSKIVLAELLTDEDNVIVDTVDAFDDTTDPDTITLVDLEETLDLDDDAVLVRNLQLGVPEEGDEVVVVVDDDDVVLSVVAIAFDASMLLTGIDLDEEELEGYDVDAADLAYDLADYNEVLIVKDGQMATIDDLAELDVVHVIEIADSTIYLEAYTNAVEGEVEEITAGSTSVKITIDGEDYTLVLEGATSSTDANDSFAQVVDETNLSDFAGEDVTVYLDRDGNVRHISADVDVVVTEDIVGLVTLTPEVANQDWDGDSDSEDTWNAWGPPGDAYYTFKILTPEGDTLTYSVYEDDAEDVFGYDPAQPPHDPPDPGIHVTPFYTGDLVTATVDEDGELTEVVLESAEITDKMSDSDGSDIDEDYNRVQIDGDWYKVTSNTIIFERDLDDECEAISWAMFQTVDGTDDGGAADTLDVELWHTGVVADIIIITDDEDAAEDIAYGAAAEDEGIVYKRYVTADGTAFRILFADGTTANYLAPSTNITSHVYDNYGGGGPSLTDIDKFDLVSFEVNADGDAMTSLDETARYEFTLDGTTYDYVYINRNGIDVDNLILEVRGREDPDGAESTEILLSADTVIYDCTGTYPAVVDFSDLRTGYQIQVFGDQYNVTYVKIVDK